MPVQTEFDLDAFVAAYNAGDTERFVELFTDDLECIEVDQRTPPSNPAIHRGKDALREYLESAPPEITHEIVDAFVAGDRAAVAVLCRYPEGGLVRENALLTLRDGRVARWDAVQAWDA